MKVFAIGAATFLTIPAGLLKADTLAYMEQGNTDFGILDLTTGVYTELGQGSEGLTGLGEFDGQLYGGADGKNTVDQVSTTNGFLTQISQSGPVPTKWIAFGSTTSYLYGIDSLGELFSVNPVSGLYTDIGPTGFTDVQGVSADATSLYVVEPGSKIYTINTSTGTPTLLNGNDGISVIGALVYTNGTLYAGAGNFPDQSVATVDTATGDGTLGPAVTGNTAGFYGLAVIPAPTTPEPASLGLFLCGAAAILAFRSRFVR